jgi:solute:Na+ symporter, SSS family
VTATLAAVLAFLAVQLGIGVWVSRRIKSESDYLVAGRSLGYLLATFSIFATWFGAESMVGSSGSAYREGLTPASAEPFGYGLCLIVMGLIFAVPLWKRKLTTLADLYRQRFSSRVEHAAALILIPGSVLWAAAQIRAFGHVLTTTTSSLDVNTAIGIAALFTIGYTMFGGLLVDAIADVMQGLLLMVALLILAIAVGTQLGGFESALAAIARSDKLQLSSQNVGTFDALEAWAIPVFGSVLATELVGRVIATRTGQIARNSALMAGAMYIAVGLIPVFIGLVGTELVGPLDDPEQLLPIVAREVLPTIGYVVFAGGLIAAILSTVDSTLLMASGLLSHNLLIGALGVTNERTKVLSARLGVMGFGAIAYFLAVRSEGVFELVEQASAFGSSGTLVTATFGLFTTFGGARTAMTTLLAGVTTYLVGSYGGFAYPFLLSLVTALAVYVVGGTLEWFGARNAIRVGSLEKSDPR